MTAIKKRKQTAKRFLQKKKENVSQAPSVDGYSGYHAYEKSRPIKTIYADLDAINNYMDTLNTEE